MSNDSLQVVNTAEETVKWNKTTTQHISVKSSAKHRNMNYAHGTFLFKPNQTATRLHHKKLNNSLHTL